MKLPKVKKAHADFLNAKEKKELWRSQENKCIGKCEELTKDEPLSFNGYTDKRFETNIYRSEGKIRQQIEKKLNEQILKVLSGDDVNAEEIVSELLNMEF